MTTIPDMEPPNKGCQLWWGNGKPSPHCTALEMEEMQAQELQRSPIASPETQETAEGVSGGNSTMSPTVANNYLRSILCSGRYGQPKQCRPDIRVCNIRAKRTTMLVYSISCETRGKGFGAGAHGVGSGRSTSTAMPVSSISCDARDAGSGAGC